MAQVFYYYYFIAPGEKIPTGFGWDLAETHAGQSYEHTPKCSKLYIM